MAPAESTYPPITLNGFRLAASKLLRRAADALDSLAVPAAPAPSGQPSSSPQVLAIYRAFLAECQRDVAAGELAPGTLSAYEAAVFYLERALKGVRCGEFTSRVAGDLRASLSAPRDGFRLRPSTQALYLRAARAAWNWARAQGMVSEPWPAPPKKHARRAAARRRTQKRPLEPAELAALLEWIREETPKQREIYLPALQLLADTGARADEPCACNVEHLTIEDGQGWLLLPRTKLAEPRRVPVLPEVVAMVDLDRSPSRPLLPASRGPRLSAKAIWKVTVRGLDALGLREEATQEQGQRRLYRVDAHSFRRSFVTDAEEAGVPQHHQELIVGHRPQTVHGSYRANATPHDLHSSAAAVKTWRASVAPSKAWRQMQVGGSGAE